MDRRSQLPPNIIAIYNTLTVQNEKKRFKNQGKHDLTDEAVINLLPARLRVLTKILVDLLC